MAASHQAARITDPITHGLGLVGIAGGMLVGAVAGLILIAALPVTAPALLVGLAAAAAVGAVAGGGLAGHQLLAGVQRACALPSPTTGLIGAVGSLNVRIGRLPAARVVSEMATSCNGLYALSHLPIPPLPQARIAEGAATIRINGLFAARVSSKLECGASIQQGALNVYFGGPTERVLAVVDLESAVLSLLGFLAKASLVAAFLLAIPMGLGAIATFAVFVGGFMAVNYGLGVMSDKLPPGWGGILQGSFGLAAVVGGAALGAKGLERTSPESFDRIFDQSPPKGARGTASGRPFDPDNAGGPIRSLSSEDIKITQRGIEVVQQHVQRFGPDPHNEAQISRLRAIADSKLEATDSDRNFYAHELREYVRYRNLGYATGEPTDPTAARELWNNAHTAALEEYGLKEGPGVLYHPDNDPWAEDK